MKVLLYIIIAFLIPWSIVYIVIFIREGIKIARGEISREDYDQLKSFLELLKKKRENETKGLDIHGKPLAGGEIRAHKAKTFFERTRDELGDTADEKKSKEILERVIAIQTEREKGV